MKEKHLLNNIVLLKVLFCVFEVEEKNPFYIKCELCEVAVHSGLGNLSQMQSFNRVEFKLCLFSVWCLFYIQSSYGNVPVISENRSCMDHRDHRNVGGLFKLGQ